MALATEFFHAYNLKMEVLNQMKRKATRSVLAAMCILALAVSMTGAAFAADAASNDAPVQGPVVCYPTAVTRSEDGSEIRKMYDLGPEDDPAGIPRSDFMQDGFSYTMVELLKQELPENESRQHTETISVASKNKDMASVLALLPETREFITDDGLAGVLTLKLDTVKVTVAGYGSSTKELTATRTYPGLASQDTQYIPKTIEDGGNTLTLQSINWQSEADGHFTAVASYSGTTTSSYVKGYTVTADYTGTVSRINLNKVRYVAIFEGTALNPEPEEPTVSPDPDVADGNDIDPATPDTVSEKNMLIPVCVVVVAVLGVGVFFIVKRRKGW